MFTCLVKSQLARNKVTQYILMLFNFEKVLDYYRICMISYFEKIQFLCAIFKSEWRNRYLFFWDGNRIARFFFQKYPIEIRKIQKNQLPLSHQKIQRKIASDYSDFCHYFCCLFLFCHNSHFRQKLENVLTLVRSHSQYVIELKSWRGWALIYVAFDDIL